MVHLCSGKQRELQKDERHVRLGLQVFYRFYQTNSSHKAKTWDDFRTSRYFNDFIKVGRYLADINAVNPSQFIEFLVRSGLPVTKWTSPSVYEVYITDLSRRESPDTAVSRNVLLMQQWATENDQEWTNFFRNISAGQALVWITTGRISPWMIFICESANALLDRFSPEQMSIVGKYLDPKVWGPKLDSERQEVDRLRQLFEEVGV